MRMRVCLAAGLMLVVAAAHAELTPTSAGYDTRVQSVDYNPLNVVRIVASPSASTQLIFGRAETITQVAIGEADAWLAQPTGNLLFLKPVGLKGSTNMQVVTRLDGGDLRSYQFRLITVGRRARQQAMYAVAFRYPSDEAAARSAQRARTAQAAAERAAEDKVRTAWAEGPRNYRYVAQGSRMLEPTEVSDNGRQTAFRFPGTMRVPTIFVGAPDGEETIAPYTMNGDRAVVQTTARIFTLRDGREVLRIINQGFDPVGRDPGTGTGTADVTRRLRSSVQ